MLNKKKPFGEVHGGAAYAFTQDDKFFNAQGYEVSETGKPIEKTLADAKAEADADKNPDPRAEKVKEVEAMTVEAIKLKLDQYGAEYDKKALKPDLVAMLVDEELAD